MDKVKTSTKSQTAADMTLTPTAMELNAKQVNAVEPKEEIPKKPPIDLFKAIFEDDEDEDEKPKISSTTTPSNNNITEINEAVNTDKRNANTVITTPASTSSSSSRRKRASDWMT